MARPAADYKILNDNRSSYNLIAHDHHVPRSPLFGPSMQQQQADTRWAYEDNRGANRMYEANRGDNRGDARGEQRSYAREDEEKRQWEELQAQETARARLTNRSSFEYRHPLETIRHEKHVPASPLYRPGDESARVDPRYGSAHLGARQNQSNEDEELVPRPRDPPTPDYNTSQLQIPDNRDDDTKLQLGNMRGSQEDLRDYSQNNAAWAGYQDRPAPCSDRPGYLEERSYRANPWTQRARGQGEVIDPRIGGNPDGGGYLGARNGGALLFIRFPIGQGENIQVAAQAFLKSITHDTGGRFLGLAKRVYDFGYEKSPIEAIGVYHFPTMEKAKLFFQMDTIMRQPDFPPPYGHSEMWIVCNAYLPDNLKLFDTFLLSEVKLHKGKEKRDFFERFQKPFERYLYKNGAMPFVICSYGSYDRKSLRAQSYPDEAIVTCHLFQGMEHLNWLTKDEIYCKLRSLHNQLATEKCSIFTLCRDLFP